MTNRRIAESAYLAARAKAMKWREDFAREWAGQEAEITLLMLAKRITELPEEVRDQVKQMHPEAYKKVEELTKRREK